MAFAQLTYRESLRDTPACLWVAQPKLYYMGLLGMVARNTLAHANEVGDWRIYTDFTLDLITTARPLYTADPSGIELSAAVFAFDSTTIDLCLALFPWATFRKRKRPRNSMRCWTCGATFPPSCSLPLGPCTTSISSMPWSSRRAPSTPPSGYLDFVRLYRLHRALGFFVTRAKGNLWFRYLDSLPVDRTLGVYSDRLFRLSGSYSHQGYPSDSAGSILRR